MLAPFIAYRAMPMDAIGDGNVGSSMTFQDISNKYLNPLTPNPLTLKALIPNP